jgi:homoserine dehydrogenase
VQRRAELAEEYGLSPKIVAISDKDGAAINPKGLDLEKMLAMISEKRTVATSCEYGHPSMSALSVIESVEAETLVEATPTNVRDGEPGLSHIKTAFKTGKHVVTTNKGPLALALPVLTELAEYNKVHLRFSGTVGGGTPVLDLAKRCLLGEKIVSVRGVLNGTTNHILTEMDEKHITFKQALEDAQKLGYAETDPSNDIDGIDTACKLVIIANWIMNKKVTLKDVKVQGIRDITLQHLENAAKKGHVVKLIGSISNTLKVAPTEIDRHDPMSVRGVLNAVTFVSEFAGEETIIGRGAGGTETASAVLRDLLWIKGNLTAEMAD